MTRFLPLLLVTLVIAFTTRTKATDLFYSDGEDASASGRYIVSAKSPDNQKKTGRKSFQASFVYTCKDTQTGKILWTRNQPMGKPRKLSDDSDSLYTPALEGSPSRIYVSDTGNTVIYTGWGELIVLDIKGKEVGILNVLRDCLTKEENKNYVFDTTAGPMWEVRSHWYFVEVNSQEFFIIRPWWGRRLIIELATARTTPATKEHWKAIAEAEKTYVISVLQGALDGTIKKCVCCGGPHEAAFAAYLAGVLNIKEVIPALRKLEGDTSSGSSTIGGFEEIPQGRINPFNYSTYRTRQSIHLALRRLGEKPGPFPCTEFKTEHKDYDKMKPYNREVVEGSRQTNATKLNKGMSPEQVINLLDCPDYIPNRTWQYDIDADEPYTLEISWTDDLNVEKIKVIRPALWKDGTSRDSEF